MNVVQLAKLVDKVEDKLGEYVYARTYGDGSGGMYLQNGDELCTWDTVNEISGSVKEYMKNG